ncbi:NADPH:quinone oxidoreductase family protein [Hoeflea prorocentri]|uniref:NADPH:quinone oxidoreductase family protein n=1 Tax=Hoeflea prorocentri TaxID=1922333 RepID=A0A9X3ZHE2_9HYPH|nr:NADPH:quinone oxidoreductase family protein [Hoeflea prorocentri]MCY6380818.1 NADPH:quinone oxidoreductase family protein [Hoeflea prorocentri]MDA5398618.1 NADPH:quinone oxidoreductase family protein [Hoeflea prorocentri]
MKAVVCEAYGPLENLEYKDIDDPHVKDHTVVVRSEAIGVNYPDGLLVKGLYQMKPPTPFVPGMEVAGIVESVGSAVEKFKPGDRVAALGQLGGYAELVAVPQAAVFPLPPDMDAANACALLCAYGTSHHALKQRAELKPGETIAILGAAGSTGIAAIQIAKVMGARVIAVASSPEKQSAARAAGADDVIGYDNLKDDLKGLTGGKGVDVLFDPVGGDAFDAACRAMARKGRLLVVGFASGRIPELPANLTLVKEFSLVGVFWGSFTQHEPQTYADNMKELIGWYLEGKVKPHIEGRYPLQQAADVLTRVLDRGAVGKLVLVPEGA